LLINCVAYQKGRKLADLAPSEIHQYLARPDCFVWVGLKDADDAELEAMQRQFNLHPLAVEDARHGHQRPKIEEYGQSLFVVLHMIEGNGEELTVGELGIFVGSNYVLSVRSRSEQGFKDVRKRCEDEPELLRHGPGYVLYTLMDAVVDRYFPVLAAIETELERVETHIFGGFTERGSIEALYGIKQNLMTLRHATAPLLDAAGKLYGGRVPQLVAALQDYFRDVADHLVRLTQAIDSMRDMVNTAVSMSLSLITLQENEVTKRLAAYGALVAVPTMIAGIYGMNFEHMPEIEWFLGYPLALIAMFSIDVYLFYRFRKAQWL
jgi:magnesium transporter